MSRMERLEVALAREDDAETFRARAASGSLSTRSGKRWAAPERFSMVTAESYEKLKGVEVCAHSVRRSEAFGRQSWR